MNIIKITDIIDIIDLIHIIDISDIINIIQISDISNIIYIIKITDIIDIIDLIHIIDNIEMGATCESPALDRNPGASCRLHQKPGPWMHSERRLPLQAPEVQDEQARADAKLARTRCPRPRWPGGSAGAGVCRTAKHIAPR